MPVEATHGGFHERLYATLKCVAFHIICEYGGPWRPHRGASTSAFTEALKWVAFFNICEYGSPWRPNTGACWDGFHGGSEIGRFQYHL